MAEPAYQRLTRDRIAQQFGVVAVPRVSLWLGSDHLLLVEHSGFTETYKRFYFRDNQAITVRGTPRQTIWNGVLALPLAIGLIGFMISAAPTRNPPATIFWAIFSVIFLLPFIVNNVRGPACVCQLRTAVQIENLGSVSRVRQARKVLDKIRPLIAAAQGQLAPEEVSLRLRAIAPGAKPQEPEPPPGSPPVLA
jgi:hypothetical protein